MQETVDALLKLVKEESFRKLSGGWGGCPCHEIFLYGVRVESHCWRTCSLCQGPVIGIHISFDNGDLVDEKDHPHFKPLVEELQKQLEEIWGEGDFNVVFKPRK